MDLLESLNRLVVEYAQKIDKNVSLDMSLKFVDVPTAYDVQISEGKVAVQPSDESPKDVHFTLSKDLFEQILRGDIEAFTAAAKGDFREEAPLDWRVGNSFSPEKLKHIYHFLMYFFTESPVKVTKIGEQYARKVHGALAIPLYYHEGLRSAWYMIKPGEQLNEEGDKNPFEQAMIVLQGEGQAKFAGEEMRVRKNRAYHIPKDSEHVVYNDGEEDIVLIFLAYGKGA